MPYGPNNFPSAGPVMGLNPYTTLPEVIDASYQGNADMTGAAVTPSDTLLLPHVVTQLLLGTAGNLAVVLDSGGTLLLVGLAAGVVHKFPFGLKQIKATGTTATGIVGIG